MNMTSTKVARSFARIEAGAGDQHNVTSATSLPRKYLLEWRPRKPKVMDSERESEDFCNVVDAMTSSIISARGVITELLLRQKNTSSDSSAKEGISLLSMKSHTMLSYLHSLTLLASHRMLGKSLTAHSPPELPFGSSTRPARGLDAGDIVDSLVEDRVILEKIKMLEGRMKYQIDKLVRLAEDTTPVTTAENEDPLAFRPKLDNLLNDDSDKEGSQKSDENSGAPGIYRPPKVAPVPYTAARSTKSRDAPAPSALASLQYLDPSAPHTEKTSGLGVSASMASSRARELQRMTEFEEENMTRLVLNKKDSKRRRRDEEEIALGGAGGTGRGRPRGGLADEFRDILHSAGKSSTAPSGDGYEELRQRGKRKSVLERSRTRNVPVGDNHEEDIIPRKRARFEQEMKKFKKLRSKK